MPASLACGGPGLSLPSKGGISVSPPCSSEGLPQLPSTGGISVCGSVGLPRLPSTGVISVSLACSGLGLPSLPSTGGIPASPVCSGLGLPLLSTGGIGDIAAPAASDSIFGDEGSELKTSSSSASCAA